MSHVLHILLVEQEQYINLMFCEPIILLSPIIVLALQKFTYTEPMDFSAFWNPAWLITFQQTADIEILSLGSITITVGRLLLALGIMLGTLIVVRINNRIFQRMALSKRTVLSESGLYALSRILLYLWWGLGIMFALHAFGLNFSSLALFGGAVGIGVGLGLQTTFSNFVSGVVILLEKTIKVGDYVELESGASGRVSEINVRYTRMTTNDAVDIIVPNSEIINNKLSNWTLHEPHRRIHVPFSVAYGSDKDVVREAGLAAADAIANDLNDPEKAPDVWLVGFGENGLQFQLVVWVGKKMATAPARTQARYLWALEDALRARGLVVPFPQRDIRIVSGSVS